MKLFVTGHRFCDSHQKSSVLHDWPKSFEEARYWFTADPEDPKPVSDEEFALVWDAFLRSSSPRVPVGSDDGWVLSLCMKYKIYRTGVIMTTWREGV